MSSAKFETPALKPYPVIPLVAEGAMAHSRPFVASQVIQARLGFPDELVEGWEQRAVAKMGELLGKYRSLRVYMDACVHCGACSDKCHYFLGTGDTVDVSVDAQPNKKYVGKVLEILPAADVRSRSFTVKVGVLNQGGKLREGMFARGSVVLQRNKRTLKVPVSAVTRRDDKNWVVKVEGTRGIPCEVVIGGTRDGLVEISEGTLLPGDSIAVEGAGDVTKEQTVKIAESGKSDGPTPAATAEADKPKSEKH